MPVVFRHQGFRFLLAVFEHIMSWVDPFSVKERGSVLSGVISRKESYPQNEFTWLIPHEGLRLQLLRFTSALQSPAFEPAKPWKVCSFFTRAVNFC